MHVRAAALAALAAFGAACGSAAAPARAAATRALVDAAARAAGNRRPAAVALGTMLFTRIRPAQLVKVRIDGAGTHEVAGLVLSAVKFHSALDRAGFTSEVIELVRSTFAASDVEEVDCWATVPFAQGHNVVVTGDMAQPTSRTVFAVSVLRTEAATFADRVRRGIDVFWDPGFAARLAGGGGPGSSRPGA